MSVITQYPFSEIRRFLEKKYGIQSGFIEKTNQGLDNSVYFINNAEMEGQTGDFVLKIVETKSKKGMKRSLAVASNVRKKHSPVTYFPTITNGEIVTNFSFSNKPAILSNRIVGEHLAVNQNASIKKYAKFIAKIHGTRSSKIDDSTSFAQNELSQIRTYWTKAVEAGVKLYTPARYSIYDELASIVLEDADAYLKDASLTLPSYVGFTHGDLNPSNVIVTEDGRLTAIDFDGASKKGFQLSDVFQAAGKSQIGSDIQRTQKFLQNYYDKMGVSLSQEQEESLIRWLAISSLRAALSTEFYTHVIPKISPEWNVENAGDTISSLSETMQETMNFLKLT